MTDAELSVAHLKLHAFNRVLSTVIRIGIAISMVLILTGLAIYSVHGNTAAGKLVPVLSLPVELVRLDPAAFITLGLTALLLIPPVILLASFIHFIAARQKKPVIVCALLIVLLIISMMLPLLIR